MKSRPSCRTCTHRGGRWEANSTFWHDTCKASDSVGEHQADGLGSCVCNWVAKNTRPRGCPGYEKKLTLLQERAARAST